MSQDMQKTVSLRWQWTVYLSAAFIVLYVIAAIITGIIIQQKDYQLEKERFSHYTQTIQDRLWNHSSQQEMLKQRLQSVLAITLDQKDSRKSELLYGLDQDDIDIQILDSSETIIYESRPMPYITFNDKKLGMWELDGKLLISEKIMTRDNRLQGYIVYVQHLTAYHHRMQEFHRLLWVISLIAVVAAVVLANILAYIFFKPIKHMRDIMQDIKEDALSKKRMDLSQRRPDELTDLSVGFNELLDTMDLYINQQKQFVEDVSHELRTPVAIVEGHLKLLNRWGKEDPIVLEESLDASLSEISRMKNLVQEMLDLSRAEQVGIHYKDELVEIGSLVEQVHQNVQLIHPTFHIRLDKDSLRQQELWAQMSRHHLEQVIIILLDNAVKYSTDNLYIHLSVSRTLNKVQISVQDFGEGIAESDLHKVFGRFYRVDKARSRHKGGNGLGLAIAKELVEGYKGTLSVESVLNNGTTFRIELPIVTDQAVVVKAKRKRHQKELV